jgi:asparagine synthase (glutamine-hydrolysing)
MEACVKEKLLTPHYVYPDAEGLLKDLDALILQQEEPFASASLYASWCVYREAHSQSIKVLLNGHGADEVFGYDYMAAFYFRELFTSFRWATLLRELFLFYRKQKGVAFTFKLFAFLLIPQFLRSRLIRMADPLVNKAYYDRHHTKSRFHEVFLSSSTLNENVRNHLLMKLHHLLRVEDKNSMRFGVEGRVPFLEYKLVEFGLRVPSGFKVRNGEVKHILKEAMHDLLPAMVYRRNNKIGYETPMDDWFREPRFACYISTMLASDLQPMASRLEIPVIRAKWEAHLAKQENNGAAIWKYLYLTRWHQLYFHSKAGKNKLLNSSKQE